jgi:hypothetical protein
VIGAVNTQQVMQNVELLQGAAVPDQIKSRLAEVFSAVEEVVLTPLMWDK